MLVLSRFKDQKIIIGDSIEVEVVEVRGDRVRIGITAPDNVPIHREEVYEEIKRTQNERITEERNA